MRGLLCVCAMILLLPPAVSLAGDPSSDLQAAFNNVLLAVQSLQADQATDASNAAALAAAQTAKANSATAVTSDNQTLLAAKTTMDAAIDAILNPPPVVAGPGAGPHGDFRGGGFGGFRPGPMPGPHYGGYGGGYDPFRFVAPAILNYATAPRIISNPLTGQPQLMTPGYWASAPVGSAVPYIWQNTAVWPLTGSAKPTLEATGDKQSATLPRPIKFFKAKKPVRKLIGKILHPKG